VCVLRDAGACARHAYLQAPDECFPFSRGVSLQTVPHLFTFAAATSVQGSGKTLAFGLPIMQLLVEEKEEAAEKLASQGHATAEGERGGEKESGEAAAPGKGGSEAGGREAAVWKTVAGAKRQAGLRALILAPTRELALQVSNGRKAEKGSRGTCGGTLSCRSTHLMLFHECGLG
jgi:hypothetical protein